MAESVQRWSRAWNWIYTAMDMIQDYNKGNATNKQQHNADFNGTPGSGKNHTKSVIEEWAMRGDHAKVIFPHASEPSHMQEIYQFLFPNGHHHHQEFLEEQNKVIRNLEEARYGSHETTMEEIRGLEELPVDERMRELETLIDQETNNSLKSSLRQMRDSIEEWKERKDMVEKNIFHNRKAPRRLKKIYDDSQGAFTYFNIQVLCPVSANMPDIPYPDHWNPFAIPVDRFKEHDMDSTLQIIWGDRNHKTYRELYDEAVQVGDASFSDLKSKDISVDKPHVEERKIMDEELEVFRSRDRPKQALKRFRQIWGQMFNQEGILASSDYEEDLRSQLKEMLLDDETDIIVLYTGFLRNTILKKFVMTYFMEIYQEIIDNLDSEEEKGLDRKFILDFLEAQSVIKVKTEYESLNTADKQFNSFIDNFMDESRHYNTDIWVDVKPHRTHPMIMARTEHDILTQVNPENWGDIFEYRDKELKDDAKTAMMDNDYQELERSRYGMGFIFFDQGKQGIVQWQKSKSNPYNPGRTTYGYRHIAPRMCIHEEISFSHYDLTDLERGIKFKARGNTVNFSKYMEKLFFEDWKESEREAIKKMDKKIEEERKQKEREEQKLKQTLQETVKTKLENRFYANDRELPRNNQGKVSFSEWLEEIKEEKDIDRSKRTLQTWTEDKRKELKEMAKKEPEDEIDPRDIADNMRVHKRFILAQGKEGKKNFCRRWIKDNYDVRDQYAAEVAAEATDMAINDLSTNFLINNSLNLDTEGDDKEEKLENYKKKAEELGWAEDGGLMA